jgi:DNA mismatch repair protein MSH5
MLGGETLVVRAKVFEQFEGYHLAQVGRRISETVRPIHNRILMQLTDMTKVDLEKSAEESRTVMLPGIDEELDQMKRVFEGLPDLLNQVARKLSETVPSDVQGSLNVVYFPQIGFLVTVPIVPTTGAAVHSGSFDNPWECMFSTEEVYLGHLVEQVLTFIQRSSLLQEQPSSGDGRPLWRLVRHDIGSRD